MNRFKTNLLIIVGVILSLIFLLATMVIISNRVPSEDEIGDKSDKFVLAWGNFTDETSQTYRDSFAKYVSSDYLASYADTANEMKELRGEQSPSTSTFTLVTPAKVSKRNKVFSVEVIGKRKYSYEENTYQEKVTMTWEKTNMGYRIIDAYAEPIEISNEE